MQGLDESRDVLLLDLDLEVLLVEEDGVLRRLAVPGVQGLDGERDAALPQHLEHVEQDPQVPVPQAEAQEQEQAASGQLRVDVAGQRRVLGDQPGQEVEQLGLGEDHGVRLGDLAVEVEEERRALGRIGDPLVVPAAVVIALDAGRLPRDLERGLHQGVVGAGDDVPEGQRGEVVMEPRAFSGQALVPFGELHLELELVFLDQEVLDDLRQVAGVEVPAANPRLQRRRQAAGQIAGGRPPAAAGEHLGKIGTQEEDALALLDAVERDAATGCALR